MADSMAPVLEAGLAQLVEMNHRVSGELWLEPTPGRRAFCERYAGTAVTVLGTHFHHPTAGRIVRRDAGWRFQVDTP